VVNAVASQCQGQGFDSWLGSLSVWSLPVLPHIIEVYTMATGPLAQLVPAALLLTTKLVAIACIWPRSFDNHLTHVTDKMSNVSGSSFQALTTLCVKKLPLWVLLYLSPLLNLRPLVLDSPTFVKRD